MLRGIPYMNRVRKYAERRGLLFFTVQDQLIARRLFVEHVINGDTPFAYICYHQPVYNPTAPIMRNDLQELSDHDQRVLSKLKKVKGDSGYAFACREIKSVAEYRKVVAHLLEQMESNAALVKVILGEGAFDAIQSL